MKAIFIDEYDSSKINGIGTYRDMLLPILGRKKALDLIIVSLNAIYGENIKVIQHNYGIELAMPHINEGDWRNGGNIIMKLLNTYVRDSNSNVFMLNHSPASCFIKEIKKKFPKSSLMFTVHDQGWCGALMGSRKLLEDILLNNLCPSGISEKLYEDVMDYCNSEDAIYQLVDKVVSISPFMSRVLRDVYKVPMEKCAMIYNGYSSFGQLNMSKFEARIKLGFKKDEELLIFAGRPVLHKGIVPLLEALYKLRRNRPNLRLIMCGELSGFEKYGRLIKRCASSLVFTGQLPRYELPLWYRAADVGVVPSYSEPFGYSAVEMVDMGLPIVVSNGTGLQDIYSDNINAFVASIGEDVTNLNFFVQSLCVKIQQAFDASEQLRDKFARENKGMIRKRFSIEKMSERYYSLIKEIVLAKNNEITKNVE